jgi:hypothetical protein
MAELFTIDRQVDAYHELESSLRPKVRERIKAKRQKWLDGLVSPFARKMHLKAERARRKELRH